MAMRERINPKTGEKEYKARYYFYTEGKKRDSETGWFPTAKQAQKEAEALKIRKEAEYLNNINSRRDRTIYSVFKDFVEHCKKEKEKNKSNTDVKNYTISRAIYNHYIPEGIMNFKINELTTYQWKLWMNHINAQESIGGLYVRQCRQQLLAFNVWLSHNNFYLDPDTEDLIDVTIRRVKIKSTKVGNREESGDRNILSLLDFRSITYYYYSQGIEHFYNFYYYTLFYVLFFSGVRVEELTGLQWKFLDLRDSQRKIYIKNAISKIEDKENALERVRNCDYRTKNKTSVRIIPIFDFYYNLLLDYKESYRYEYNLSKKEIEECFVFPNIEVGPHEYLRAQQILRELRKACDAANVAKTDLQMFRHSCATFLILPPPNGLGFTEEKVKDYFGHTDTKMLQNVYARLNTYQKADRMVDTFSSIYRPSETDERNQEEKLKEELLKRMQGDNHKAQYARKLRILKQIDRAVFEKRGKYYYNPKDRKIIDEWLNKASDIAKNRIEFIEEEE